MITKTIPLYGSVIEHNAMPSVPAPTIAIPGKFNNSHTSLFLNQDILSKHILMIGGTGCGKTNVYYHIVDQIKRRLTPNDVMIIFDTKGDYYEDLACVEDNNGKYGFIDRAGKLVIPCKWNGAGIFSQGLANVRSDNGKWGYIDKSGTLVIPCKWKEANHFVSGRARVKGDDDKYYTINETGTIICWFSVKSFRLLETDLTANTRGTEKYDQNGEKAALIKIITTMTDLRFNGFSLGIVGTEKKEGELWLYLPRRAQRLNIIHPSLGILRDYFYPIPIQSARTYEMILDVGTLNN